MYDPRIDEALDSMPVAALPKGFTSRVMAKVERPQVRFRLTFLDLALPSFFTLFATLIVGTAVWIYTTIDPLWSPRFILFDLASDEDYPLFALVGYWIGPVIWIGGWIAGIGAVDPSSKA